MENTSIIFNKIEKIVFLSTFEVDNFDPEYFIKKINDNIDNKLSYKTNVKNERTDWKLFVDDQKFFNILNNLKDKLNFFNLKNIFLESAWGTKSQNYVETIPHDHNPAALCGILYLTENGPGTYFDDLKINVSEKIGKICLFNGFTNHSVKKVKLLTDRYLISFNFMALKSWDVY